MHRVFFSCILWIQAKTLGETIGKICFWTIAFQNHECWDYKIYNYERDYELFQQLGEHIIRYQWKLYFPLPRFSRDFFVPRLFYSNSNYIKRNINYLFVFVCPHPISGYLGQLEKAVWTVSCMIYSVIYIQMCIFSNFYWNVSSWQWTELQNID